MGIQKTSNGKFRVQIQVKGRGRKGCTVNTYDEAVLAEDKLKKALIDGKEIGLTISRSEVTLQQACEATWNDPENGWIDTDHGRKQKYYFGFIQSVLEIKL